MGGKQIFVASLTDKTLKINYSPGWEEYLNEYPQFRELVAMMTAKLSNTSTATEGVGKGSGKGKSK